MTRAGSSWYVAATLPRRESLAKTHLERQGFETFLPKFLSTRQVRQKRATVLSPIFPGYIFVQFDAERDPWRSINGTIGIKSLIGCSGERPDRVATEFVRALQSRCINDVVQSIITNLLPGDIVQICSGPLGAQIAHIERLDAHGRVRVLLNVLGRETRVELNRSSLGPV